MDRRKFLKNSLQIGSAGLLSTLPYCQGSWTDPFETPANEAIMISTPGVMYRVNLSSGATTPISTIGSGATAFLDNNNVLFVTSSLTPSFYQINLNDNSFSLLGTVTIPVGAGGDVGTVSLIGGNDVMLNGSYTGGAQGYLYRLNLTSMTGSVVLSLLAPISGHAIENDQTLLAQLSSGNVYRFSLTDYSNTLLVNAGASKFNVALAPGRNLLLIAHGGGIATQLKRVDLKTNTVLSDLGALPNGAGAGIALESNSSVLTGDTVSGGLYRVNLDNGATSRVDDGTLTGVVLRNIAVRFQ